MKLKFKVMYYYIQGLYLKEETEEILRIKERLLDEEVKPFFEELEIFNNSPEKFLLEALNHCRENLDLRPTDEGEDKGKILKFIESKLTSGLTLEEKFNLKSILLENKKNILEILEVANQTHKSGLSLCFSDRKFDIYTNGDYYYLKTIKFKENESEEFDFKVSSVITDDLTNILFFLILSYWFNRVIDFTTRK